MLGLIAGRALVSDALLWHIFCLRISLGVLALAKHNTIADTGNLDATERFVEQIS